MTEDVDSADVAVTKLRDAVVELTPKQFDQLSVFLLQEVGPPGTIKFVPADAESDVDLEAEVDHPLLEITYGVQNAQRPIHDEISASKLRAFAANLQERNLHTGVLLTTCEISAPVKTTASSLNVTTVDGEELAELLVANELGVELSDGSVTLDEAFWDLFRGQKRSETIPSTEVPQADSIKRLDQTLKAVHSGNHEKTAIADEVSQLASVSFNPRQADYYRLAPGIPP